MIQFILGIALGWYLATTGIDTNIKKFIGSVNHLQQEVLIDEKNSE